MNGQFDRLAWVQLVSTGSAKAVFNQRRAMFCGLRMPGHTPLA
jgi:hypothetical protein